MPKDDGVENLAAEDGMLATFAADIVSAYVSNNPVRPDDLPPIIHTVHDALRRLTRNAVLVEAPKPAVPIAKSIMKDYLVCLENGQRFKSLKRHLRARYGMSPADYREKWGLPTDYPMVAPAYAKARSTLAKEMGLGLQRRHRP